MTPFSTDEVKAAIEARKQMLAAITEGPAEQRADLARAYLEFNKSELAQAAMAAEAEAMAQQNRISLVMQAGKQSADTPPVILVEKGPVPVATPHFSLKVKMNPLAAALPRPAEAPVSQGKTRAPAVKATGRVIRQP